MNLPNDPFVKTDNAQKPLYIVPFWTLREAKIAALEVDETCQLIFDKHTWTISFPAFDLRFISESNTSWKGYRNTVDVAAVDELLLRYKERLNRDESRV